MAKASERLQFLDLNGCHSVGEFGDHALKEIGDRSHPLDTLALTHSRTSLSAVNTNSLTHSHILSMHDHSPTHTSSQCTGTSIRTTHPLDTLALTHSHTLSIHYHTHPLHTTITPTLSSPQTGAFCSQLKTLDLGGCKRVEDGGLRAIAQGCPHLEELMLAGCDAITGKGFRALFKYGRSLSTLVRSRDHEINKLK